MKIARVLTAAVFATAFTVTTASAQPQGVPVIGQIQGVDANLLVVKTQAGEQKVALTNNVVVWGLEKASVSDVSKGAFIGVGATPQADGSQKAIRVIIFAEPMRGNGEGRRPWTRPNTTMTNATVDTTVSGVDGQNIMVKYKDGEKKIIIGSDAVIRKYVAGDKSELKPGVACGCCAEAVVTENAMVKTAAVRTRAIF